MTGPDNTPISTLVRASEIGYQAGLHFVYAGNIPGRVGSFENTYCPGCKALLVERAGYRILQNNLRGSHCLRCHQEMPGLWDYEKALQSSQEDLKLFNERNSPRGTLSNEVSKGEQRSAPALAKSGDSFPGAKSN